MRVSNERPRPTRASLGDVTTPTSTQKLAVVLAFVAAALSLSAVAVAVVRTGTIQATPLFGGLLMLALGVTGYYRIRQPPG
jgi:hypothetical protein